MHDAPPVERIVVRASDLPGVILPRLLGIVFHVTTCQAFEKIKTSGVVRSNQDGRLAFTFPQSRNSYGRKSGWVCLFDLRNVGEAQVQDALMKFHFLKPTNVDPVFLILDPNEYPRLIPWTVAPPAAMVIPHTEIWYPGDLPVTAITQALAVSVQADDLDSAYRGVIGSLRRDLNQMLDTGIVHIGARTVAELKQRAEEWIAVAEEGGLRVDQGWEESRVETSSNGYHIALHAERPPEGLSRAECCPECGSELRVHALEWHPIPIRERPFIPSELDCLNCGYGRPILDPVEREDAAILSRLTPDEWDVAHGGLMAVWRRSFATEERFLAAYRSVFGEDERLLEAWRRHTDADEHR